jgi:hypothetical protein
VLRRALTILPLALVLAAPFPASAQMTATGAVANAVEELRRNPVYVDPNAEIKLSEAEADELRGRIREAGAGPIYIAILPAAAADEAGGNSEGVLRAVHDDLGRPATYAVVVGKDFRAGSDGRLGVSGAKARRAAGQKADGVMPTLNAFIDELAAQRRGQSGDSGGNGDGGDPGYGGLALLGLIAGGGGLLVLSNRRRRRRREQDELEEVKRFARDDLVALGDDIRALDLDVEMPDADRQAKEDYSRAVDLYTRAEERFDAARRPADLEPVSSALEEGRWAMASAKARLAGEEPPERRAPCFFDPRHGPSVRDVEWAPPDGSPRLVPACAADAQRVEDGLDPNYREVMVGGRPTPYWNAPSYYGPWSGGFFGGFGGFLPGIFLGSALGGWGGDTYIENNDYGDGGGDFGGGDFGGGDFGGGDFGGGDFGGGGDF